MGSPKIKEEGVKFSIKKGRGGPKRRDSVKGAGMTDFFTALSKKPI